MSRKVTHDLEDSVKTKFNLKLKFFFFLKKKNIFPGPHLNFLPNDLKWSDALDRSATATLVGLQAK